MQEFGCSATFCQFSQKRSDTLSLFLAYSVLGKILINCQEMDFIELFKRSFSSSERSGFAHFPIIIDIIVLPKVIAACSFFVVKPILS